VLPNGGIAIGKKDISRYSSTVASRQPDAAEKMPRRFPGSGRRNALAEVKAEQLRGELVPVGEVEGVLERQAAILPCPHPSTSAEG
jgi:hypothetical protein